MSTSSVSPKPPTESRTVSTKVGLLNVEISGQGPAVFCWPSLYCDARTLDPLVEDLARSHRVLVVDGPGHGRSGTRLEPYSMDECADAAIAILDALGVERASWIGAAWGGQIGVAAARRHRDRLFGLIILNTPMSPWQGGKLALMRLTYALLWLFGPRSFVAGLIADAMIAKTAAPDRAALVDAVTSALGRCQKRGLLLAARSAMFERGDMRPLLPDVRVPAVFFTGAEDSLLSVAEAREQTAAIPECRFVVVEKSSHQSALEAPSQVLPVVRDALAAWSRA
jgi:pimeloyl-ACP methyl ester carboxylesterase